MNTKKKVIFFSFFAMLILMNCKSKKIEGQNSENQEIIIKTDKDVVERIYSPDKSMILILNYTQTSNPIIKYSYQIVSKDSKKLLKEGTFLGEKLEWLDNQTLKATPYIGMDTKVSDETLLNGGGKKVNYIQIKIN